MLPLLIVLGVLIAVGVLIYVGVNNESGSDPLNDRLEFYGEQEIEIESLEDVELKLSFKDRVLLPAAKKLAAFVANFTPQSQLEFTRRQLELAGQATDPTQFFLMRILLTIFLGLFGAYMGFIATDSDPTTALAYTGGGLLLGYYLPVLMLRSRIERRQKEIVKYLPDALDLLTICVEAGLGFDAAMGRVYEKWDNELGLAFGRVLREIQLGKARRDALKDMSNRMDVPDVNTFTAAVIQAEQLGVSMSKILRVQSDQMRVKRRQRAQEKAQQAPVKMMIPMTMLIFPSIWIVLLGPAVLRLMNTDGGGAF
jgi:tight adherence protein C